MLQQELIMKNPLRFMGKNIEEIVPAGGMGVVMARAGVGKTSFLVQLAINAQLGKQKVIHVALKDPVRKVCLWYDEVFKNMVQQYRISQPDRVWESILPHRFIMTFHVGGFSVPVLGERIGNLSEQGIFTPRLVLIDGLPFEDCREKLEQLKKLAVKEGFSVWFTLTTHRHDPADTNGFPPSFSPVSDLFETAIQLIPEGKEILVQPVKGAGPHNEPLARLDTSTLLLVEQA